jgi:1,4-dihydroxy-6-naphthoate synthase
VRYGFAHPEESRSYVKAHAQEMSDEVCHKHIALYVNQHSVEMGEQGEKAVETLLARGAEVGMLPPLRKRLWL